MIQLELLKFFLLLVSTMTEITVLCFEEREEDNVAIEVNRFNSEYERMWWLRQSADWKYCTNITTDNMATKEHVEEMYTEWMRVWKLWARATTYEDIPTPLKNVVDIIASGMTFMNKEDARLISRLKSQITKIYSSASISLPRLNVHAQGEAEFGALMAKFRDPVTLKKIWKSWRLEVGEKIRPIFMNLIELTNKAALENGFENLGSAWQKELGSDDILATALSLWEEVKMIYFHLHAYVRHKLKLFYGEENFSDDTLIPVHLLWGENWVALNDILMPFPDEPKPNVTEIFLLENFSVLDVVKKAEDFYVTAGLDPIPSSFWEKSMFIKPNDGRFVDCHPASYDFGRKNDYRIRMCGEVKEQSFLEAVHEIGHLQYYMAYSHLPMIYRNGANSAFHEAVGETMVYTAQNLKCLQFMKILKDDTISKEMLLNSLMKQALSKFVLLPWALTVEVWRYSLFAGEIAEEDMNEKWWLLRKKYQGIAAPDLKSAKLFDAGTKYHVANNIPYMRYFIGRFLEHQFLESLNDDIDNRNYSCWFLENKAAGKRLKKMLSVGSSVAWQDALEILTGKRHVSAGPLLKYYEPLHLWLINYNNLHNITTLL